MVAILALVGLVLSVDVAVAHATSTTSIVPVTNVVTPYATAISGDVSAGGTFLTGTTFSISTAPAEGNVALSSDGTWSYQPVTGFSGTDSFGYSVCSPPNFTGCSDGTVDIVVGPSAADYDATVAAGYPATGDVSTDGVFPAGSTFQPVSISPHGIGSIMYFGGDGEWKVASSGGYDTFTLTYEVCMPAPNDAVCDQGTIGFANGMAAVLDTSVTFPATPVDGDAAANDSFPPGSTYARVSDPAHGSVDWRPDGTYTYVPDGEFIGTDSFDYLACLPAPDDAACDDATVSIVVTPEVGPAFTG